MHDYLVKDVMTRCAVIGVHEYDSVAKAIALMDRHGISALPVLRVNTFVGVLSKSDIASERFLAELADGKTPDQIFVKALMNHTVPLSVMETQPVRAAVELMHRRGIHRVFVTNAEHVLTGVLSTTNVLKLLYVEGESA